MMDKFKKYLLSEEEKEEKEEKEVEEKPESLTIKDMAELLIPIIKKYGAASYRSMEPVNDGVLAILFTGDSAKIETDAIIQVIMNKLAGKITAKPAPNPDGSITISIF